MRSAVRSFKSFEDIMAPKIEKLVVTPSASEEWNVEGSNDGNKPELTKRCDGKMKGTKMQRSSVEWGQKTIELGEKFDSQASKMFRL